MKYLLLFFATLFMSGAGYAATTQSGIDLSKPWQQRVYRFAVDKLQHSAWGLAHSERDYLLAKRIAAAERLDIDYDVLFAAAFLHDIGVFKPYETAGADHAAVAAQHVEQILDQSGFPMEKIREVKRCILSHMFYSTPNDSETARVLHDADTLDFLGNIGIARIISVTSRHRWAKDLPDALESISKFNRELPAKLLYPSSRELAKQRVAEAREFTEALASESIGGLAL
ncbi:HD domain-containing protein [Shewanella sp. AS16]|uniref:HD domain-containing protein n=1 Tax=Shewanella sp. AS16 TaxID=2907625 RepID=UPI001F45F81B|nr:HD domain-containing protein [Shewanella sp. AS16]MCE9688151.1 HD domain-containing protein [Shewanella sp. AS16]